MLNIFSEKWGNLRRLNMGMMKRKDFPRPEIWELNVSLRRLKSKGVLLVTRWESNTIIVERLCPYTNTKHKSKGVAFGTKLGLYVDDQTTLNCVKVFVNFIADWPRGVHRVWKSDNWGNTIPLIEDEHKNLVPLYVSLFDLPSLYMNNCVIISGGYSLTPPSTTK